MHCQAAREFQPKCDILGVKEKKNKSGKYSLDGFITDGMRLYIIHQSSIYTVGKIPSQPDISLIHASGHTSMGPVVRLRVTGSTQLLHIIE